MKRIIYFNNKEYAIDDSILTDAIVALKSHFSTVMSGEGATISFDGVSYSIDSGKLTAAKNEFVSHLGTIEGEGEKVTVGGVEFPIDSTKVSGALNGLANAFDNLLGDVVEYVAGLYQTGAVDVFREQGAEAVKSMLIKSWDELLAEGLIAVNNGKLEANIKLPENMPNMNEYGFYFDTQYYCAEMSLTFIFKADGSADVIQYGDIINIPAGTFSYGQGTIDLSAMGMSNADIIENGFSFTLFVPEENMTFTFSIGTPVDFNLEGDLFYPNNGTITSTGTMFNESKNLTGIVIPNAITEVDQQAFHKCVNLVSLIVDSATINENAFVSCDNLTSVTIGDSVTSIGKWAFQNCYNLTSVTIGNSVISIEDRAFSSCWKLTHITIPDSVTTIGRYAFEDCRGLLNINIPNSVTLFDSGIFSGCISLTSITIPEGVTSIGGNAFENCDSLISVNIPGNVTSIGIMAFEDCDGLTSITIPDSITSIGRMAFNSCNNLASIIFQGSTQDWGAITKDQDWNKNIRATHVQCSDGQVAL